MLADQTEKRSKHTPRHTQTHPDTQTAQTHKVGRHPDTQTPRHPDTPLELAGELALALGAAAALGLRLHGE
eukprot:1020843-Rhodomonas_salina.1